MKVISNFVLSLSLLVSASIYSMKPANAQITPTTVYVAAAVPIASCALPSEAVSPLPTGYIAFCNTTTGLAQAIPPSTTFTLVGSTTGVASFNGRTGTVTLTDADVTGTGLKIATTVTSTAISTPQ